MSRSLKNLYPEKYQQYKDSNYRGQHIDQPLAREEKALCKQLANNKCSICGKVGLDAHHIIPLSEGGQHTQENLMCLCRSCHERVHKKVYIINPKTREISVNVELHAITEEDKQSYISEFEKLTGNILFKNTGGYYYFCGLNKIKITVAEIKKVVNYQSATELRGMLPSKKQSIEERKILAEWKAYFKATNNKPMWHQLCKVIRVWDTLSVEKKEEIFKKLSDKWRLSPKTQEK